MGLSGHPDDCGTRSRVSPRSVVLALSDPGPTDVFPAGTRSVAGRRGRAARPVRFTAGSMRGGPDGSAGRRGPRLPPGVPPRARRRRPGPGPGRGARHRARPLAAGRRPPPDRIAAHGADCSPEAEHEMLEFGLELQLGLAATRGGPRRQATPGSPRPCCASSSTALGSASSSRRPPCGFAATRDDSRTPRATAACCSGSPTPGCASGPAGSRRPARRSRAFRGEA